MIHSRLSPSTTRRYDHQHKKNSHVRPATGDVHIYRLMLRRGQWLAWIGWVPLAGGGITFWWRWHGQPRRRDFEDLRLIVLADFPNYNGCFLDFDIEVSLGTKA